MSEKERECQESFSQKPSFTQKRGQTNLKFRPLETLISNWFEDYSARMK